MKSISAFINGFSASLKSFRMILLIYLSYLAIALLLAIPFFGLFRSASGHSQLTDALMKGFDAAAIRELLSSGGKVFSYYLESFWPWVFAFLLFQLYLNGGIFSWTGNPRGRFSILEFHRNGKKFYWRYLKSCLYFLAIHLIICLILYVPYFLTTGSSTGLTDEQVVKPLLVLFGLHGFLLIFIFLWSDLVKARIFEQDSKKVFKSIFRCLGMALRHFFSFYFLGLLLLAMPLILFVGFYLLRVSMRVDTMGVVLLLFLVQQVLIFLRVFLRVWRLSAAFRYYLKISM